MRNAMIVLDATQSLVCGGFDRLERLRFETEAGLGDSRTANEQWYREQRDELDTDDDEQEAWLADFAADEAYDLDIVTQLARRSFILVAYGYAEYSLTQACRTAHRVGVTSRDFSGFKSKNRESYIATRRRFFESECGIESVPFEAAWPTLDGIRDLRNALAHADAEIDLTTDTGRKAQAFIEDTSGLALDDRLRIRITDSGFLKTLVEETSELAKAVFLALKARVK